VAPTATPTASPSPTVTPWFAELPDAPTLAADVPVKGGSEITRHRQRSGCGAGIPSYECDPRIEIYNATLIDVTPDVEHGQIWLELRVRGTKVVRNDTWECVVLPSLKPCAGSPISQSKYQGVTLWVAVTPSTVVFSSYERLGTGLDVAAQELRLRAKFGDLVGGCWAGYTVHGSLTEDETAMTLAGVKRLDALVGVRLDPAKRQITIHCDNLSIWAG
jgi:hypothetical protein